MLLTNAVTNGLAKKNLLTILHHISMKTNRKSYSTWQKISALLMMLALLWLTVSLPFTYASQQEIASKGSIEKKHISYPTTEEESSNPFSGSEEKAPTNGSSQVSEEYLHDHHKSEYFFSIISTFHKLENAGTYVAFHGELLVPPPNAS